MLYIKWMDSNEIKLTTEEQTEVVELNAEYQNVLIDLGQIQLTRLKLKEQLTSLDTSEEECKSAYMEIEKKEVNFRNRLVKKYGEALTADICARPARRTPLRCRSQRPS